MDIPAPTEPAGEQKVAVSVSSSANEVVVTPDTNEVPSEQAKVDMKDDALAKEEARRKKIVEVINSKTFFLPIKEKRSNPILTFASAPKKVKSIKKVSHTAGQDAGAKKPMKSKQTLLIVIFILVVIGAVAAVDAGVVDIGVKLPFDFIKNV